MNMPTLLFCMNIELIHFWIGTIPPFISIILLIVILNINPNIIRSKIFLNFKKIKIAFSILTTGLFFTLISHILGLLKNAFYYIVHEIAAIILNLSLTLFLILLFFIVIPKRFTK